MSSDLAHHDLRLVASFRTLAELTPVQMRLVEEGFDVVVDEQHSSSLGIGDARSHMCLWVPSDQVESALQVVRACGVVVDDRMTLAGEDCCLACGAVFGDELDACPNCGWTWQAESAGDSTANPECDSDPAVE